MIRTLPGLTTMTLVCDCPLCRALRTFPEAPTAVAITAYVARLAPDVQQLLIAQYHVRQGTATDEHVRIVQIAGVTCTALPLD
jgi:hypothetical protein